MLEYIILRFCCYLSNRNNIGSPSPSFLYNSIKLKKYLKNKSKIQNSKSNSKSARVQVNINFSLINIQYHVVVYWSALDVRIRISCTLIINAVIKITFRVCLHSYLLGVQNIIQICGTSNLLNSDLQQRYLSKRYQPELL